MKIEKTHYVIMRQGNMDIDNETVYMSHNADGGFTNDILEADKFIGRKTALIVKQDYDLNQNNGYESDMQIIPVKVTCEW